MTNQVIEVVLGRQSGAIGDDLLHSLQDRASSGTLRAEYGSPTPAGSSVKEYIDRIRQIDESNVCASIVDVRRSDDQQRLLGKVKTAGPKGVLLQGMIDIGADLSFGMRSLRDSNYEIKTVVTFDLINPV